MLLCVVVAQHNEQMQQISRVCETRQRQPDAPLEDMTQKASIRRGEGEYSVGETYRPKCARHCLIGHIENAEEVAIVLVEEDAKHH